MSGLRCQVRGPPPTHPPWWPHTLIMRYRLGGVRSSFLSSCMPRARSARCPVSYPVSVSVRTWSDVLLVALWPDPLTWTPSWLEPPLAPLAPPDTPDTPDPQAPVCCTRGASVCHFRDWRRRRRRIAAAGILCCHRLLPCPDVGAAVQPYVAVCHILVSAASYNRLGYSSGWGVSVPSLPPSVFPRHSLTCGGHSGGFVSPGQL